MNKNKIKSAIKAATTCSCFGLAGLAGIIALAPLALTQVASAEVTAPVGYVKLTFKAQSDTPFSLPMNRPKAYAGKVASISGNVITVASNDFTANQYVYADGTQNEKYYLLFTTGTLEGRTFDVTANSVNSITVNQDGDTNVQTLINDAMATDNFEIRPHWTLNTLFPNGDNFDKSTSKFVIKGELHFLPNNLIGTNHSVSESYFYVDGDGWYDAINPLASTKFDDTILRCNQYYVVRNKSTSDITLNLVGDVPLVDQSVKLNILSDMIRQDTHIAFPYPMNLTLAETKLSSSSFFQKSTSRFSADGDILFTYDYTVAGYNKTPNHGYYFVEGEGWYDSTVAIPPLLPETTILDTTGKGFLYRTGTGSNEETSNHSVTIPYDPFAQ